MSGLCVPRPNAAGRDFHCSEYCREAERGGKDFVRFLRGAKGSAAELQTHCYGAAQVGLITVEQMNRLVPEPKEISKMLTGLARPLNKDH